MNTYCVLQLLSCDVTDQNKNKPELENTKMKLTEYLKQSLGYSTIKATGRIRSGDISQGETFIVDNDQQIFVKQNSNAAVSPIVPNKTEKSVQSKTARVKGLKTQEP
jgi:hypothetical protein